MTNNLATMQPLAMYINFGHFLNNTPNSSVRLYGGLGIGKDLHKYKGDAMKITNEGIGFLWQIGFDFFVSQNIFIGFSLRELTSKRTETSSYDDFERQYKGYVTIKEKVVNLGLSF